MTPFSSVAILEKLALLKIAFCKAPVFSRASSRRTSVMTSTMPEASSEIAGSWYCADTEPAAPLPSPSAKFAVTSAFAMWVSFLNVVQPHRYLDDPCTSDANTTGAGKKEPNAKETLPPAFLRTVRLATSHRKDRPTRVI